MERKEIERLLDERSRKFRKKNYAPFTTKKVLVAAAFIAVIVYILIHYKQVQTWLGIL